MTQKVLKVGSSAAVTIPKKSLDELGLKIGDKVTVEVDVKTKSFVIRGDNHLSLEDARIARLADSFIQRYRQDLAALAQK
ncbi:MAG TPA: AbrB/MazE/SpoVT family DNA-binding domain-containing protein [Candidatus Saccharimonadales bacterium]|nr:AbrB/MazE/SpoVT family DNA-binding domain-containing protein [Candidatus Saccharimonadales bacterium]